MKTFEIFRNGTHHATIKAKSKREATNEYSAQVGNNNFTIYEVKHYKFIYLDKYNNELHSEVNTFEDIQEARSIAKDIHQNSMLNDLKIIKVIREY
jgi:hypothetical protein